MKIFFTTLAVLVIVCSWAFRTTKTPTAILSDERKPLIGKGTVSNSSENPSSITQIKESRRKARGAYVEEIKKYNEARMRDPLLEWKQPINFYGKVVDVIEQPIPGANISPIWNDISEKGTSEATTTTDANGVFAFTGKTGKRLYVSPSKEGYYTPRTSELAFEYGSPYERFTPDPRNPVVFHLRKKGKAEPLLTSEHGMSSIFNVPVPLNARPVWVDLLSRTAAEKGELKVSQLKPPSENWKQATEWSLRLEIPDGGFVGQNEEFPFEAPKDGYDQIVEITRMHDQQNWVNIETNFYFAFGSPRKYGWLRVESTVSGDGVRFKYMINPSGSRNLEYDPKVQPKVPVGE